MRVSPVSRYAQLPEEPLPRIVRRTGTRKIAIFPRGTSKAKYNRLSPLSTFLLAATGPSSADARGERSDFMRIKLECECGQRFAFEVEPVNSRMPAPVECPACGADNTE